MKFKGAYPLYTEPAPKPAETGQTKQTSKRFRCSQCGQVAPGKVVRANSQGLCTECFTARKILMSRAIKVPAADEGVRQLEVKERVNYIMNKLIER